MNNFHKKPNPHSRFKSHQPSSSLCLRVSVVPSKFPSPSHSDSHSNPRVLQKIPHPGSYSTIFSQNLTEKIQKYPPPMFGFFLGSKSHKTNADNSAQSACTNLFFLFNFDRSPE